jgi:hypothetical protein
MSLGLLIFFICFRGKLYIVCLTSLKEKQATRHLFSQILATFGGQKLCSHPPRVKKKNHFVPIFPPKIP